MLAVVTKRPGVNLIYIVIHINSFDGMTLNEDFNSGRTISVLFSVVW